MISCLERSADFVRVLGTPPRARSAHFTVHHLQAAPERVLPAAVLRRRTKLSTGSVVAEAELVDDLTVPLPSLAKSPSIVDGGVWLGAVVPKRYARRAVTRTLLKRQIRNIVAEQRCHGLTNGVWVVRLRAPFDRTLFPSASSAALRLAARDELTEVIAAAARRVAAVARSAAKS